MKKELTSKSLSNLKSNHKHKIEAQKHLQVFLEDCSNSELYIAPELLPKLLLAFQHLVSRQTQLNERTPVFLTIPNYTVCKCLNNDLGLVSQILKDGNDQL